MDVVWTGYGRDAAMALRDAVASAKAGEPLAPVTVVVPSNHVGVASRRVLASGALGPVTGSGIGVAAVTFLTTYRLAELLGSAALAGTGRRPVSTPVLAAAMRAELTERPGLFGPVADHPATESALVSTYRELRDISPAALAALAGAGQRAREVVRLHEAARARLAPDWYDEEDLLDAAAAVAGSAAAAELGHVVVYLPQRLSLHSGRLLTALSAVVATTVIAGRTGDPAADAEAVESVLRLGVPDATPPDHPLPAPVSADRTVILTASDGDEEVRAAVRAVVDAVRAGTRLDRIAVLHASPEPYARLAHDQLRAADISTNGAAIVPLAARMAGRTLLELLALSEHDFRRQDLFAWLASGPILVDGRSAPTTAWERISREAAVVAGRADWDERLTRLAAAQDERAERYERAEGADEESDSDADEPDWRIGHARKMAAQARSLRAFVLHVIDDLAMVATTPRPWSAHAAWALAHLDALLGGARRRERWPAAERKAAERVEEALARLGALDVVEGAVPLDVFHRTLQLELEAADLGRVGRFGDGVLVGSVEMGIGLDLDLVVILGLAEGSFPSTVRDDSLLPDGERRRCGGELAERADQVERQHRQLLAALAGSANQLLCVPRGDLRRSVDRVPSRWVLDLATHLAGPESPRWWTKDLHAATTPWVHHIPSYDAGLRAMAWPATAQEHRLRSLLAGDGSLHDSGDVLTEAGADVIAQRRSAVFTRFDGNLSGVAVRSPLGSVISPTQLERWATCPHQYLVETLLKAEPIENPEDELSITPRDKGNLVHRALERFIGEVLARPASERPRATDAWTAADRARLHAIGEEECNRYETLGLTGRPIFWRRERRRILDDLGTALTHDDHHRHTHGTTPIAVELGFGLEPREGEAVLPPVRVTLPDARTLEVRGRADRLDLAEDGTIHVVDYKTGSRKRHTRLSEDDPIERGTKLQLPIYGLAGRLHQGDPDAPVRAEYWFVTRKGDFKRAGYSITDAVLEATVSMLGEIVTGIEAGRFPPHPDADGSTRPRRFITCGTCDPDGLGTVELRRHWERKRADPAMAPYADLAEPLAEAAIEDVVEAAR